VELSETYIPAKLSSDDYPNLINKDEEVSTVTVGAIIAAYNWRVRNARYANIARFVEEFITKFENLLHPSRHEKWREVNIAAETPGLQRFPVVQKLIDDFRLNERRQDLFENVSQEDLKEEFYDFIKRNLPDTNSASLSKEESEKIFREFINWRESKRIEVLHYWSSPGEAKAASVIRADFEAADGKWVDSTIVGGGGGQHAIVLRSRMLSGTAPDAIQLKGAAIQKYAEQGLLTDLTLVAAQESWDNLLLPQVQRYNKFQGRYVSVPVNIHRVDWIWANPETFKKIGAEVPKSWPEFNAIAGQLKGAGITPIAVGGEPWQEATLFEVVALGIGGTDFYKRALIQLDGKAIVSDTMKAVFDQMRILRGFVDPAYKDRSWNDTTAMVMRGEAAIQVMGDWAKGEFAAAGKEPDRDYLCIPAWSDGGFILNSDSFVFFASSAEKKNVGQNLLAKSILSKEVQEKFNLAKGSIPARSDVSLEAFDSCAKRSRQDLDLASSLEGLVGSVTHEIAQPPEVRQAFLDIVSAHFNSDMTSDEAVLQLADALARAQR
jgi:glucose/mannose transport system substrate-binding protein